MSGEAGAGRSHLLALVHGYRTTSVVLAACELGVIDALARGPERPESLATRLALHAPSLLRLLRALEALGLVERHGDACSLAPAARALADPDDGLRDWIALAGAEHLDAWRGLGQAIATGEPSFPRAFGMTAWEHRARHADLNDRLNRVMAADQRRARGALVDAYDFGATRRVVDVGGGTGALLAEILAAHPHLTGVLVDQPHVVAGARHVLDAAGVLDRCEIVGGSFFDALPAGADACVLQHILHDWDDARALEILHRCRDAIAPDGALIVVENLLEDAGAPSPRLAMLDLQMLVMLGGRERTRDEFARLLARARFALDDVRPASAGSFVLVASATP